jgi:hypothetical protein
MNAPQYYIISTWRVLFVPVHVYVYFPLTKLDKIYVKLIPQSFVATFHSKKCDCIDPEGMANKSPLNVVTYLSAHKSSYAVVQTA